MDIIGLILGNFIRYSSLTLCHYIILKNCYIILERIFLDMRGIRMNINKDKLKASQLNGAYAEIAAILGVDAALKLHNRYRGTQISFPVELLSREYIFEQINNEYDGTNVRELATKHGYTEKWIRKIVKDNELV